MSQPDVSAIVLVGEVGVALLAEAVHALRRQRGVTCEIVVVDRTPDRRVRMDGVVVVHEPSPSRGRAWRAGAAASSGRHLAWVDPSCTPEPERLARQVAALDEHPEVQLVTCNLGLMADGLVQETVDPSSAGRSQPPFWWGTVALTRDAMDRLGEEAFFPVELALLQELRRDELLGHLDLTLASLPRRAFRAVRARVGLDARLLAHQERPWQGEPEISVLIPTRGRRDALYDALESLARQDLPHGQVELIVADEGTGDTGFLDELTLAVPFHTVRARAPGRGGAYQAALERARGRLLLLTYEDMLAAPDLLSEHLSAHREQEGAAVLGAFAVPDAWKSRAMDRYIDSSGALFSYANLEEGRTYDGMSLWTTNLSVSREAVLTAGGFDPQFTDGCHDTDLGLRLEARKVPVVYWPRARAWHQHRYTVEALEARQVAVAKSFVRLFAKHPDALSRWPHAVNLTLDGTRSALAQKARMRPDVVAGAAELAALDVEALEDLGGAFADTARTAQQRLDKLLAFLNQLWWNQGYTEGFEELGVAGFPDIVSRHPVDLGTVARPVTLALPHADLAAWEPTVEAWLAGDPEGTLLLAVLPGGVPVSAVAAVAAGLLSRHPSAHIRVADVRLPEGAMSRMFGAADAHLDIGGPAADAVRRLAAHVGLPSVRPDASVWRLQTSRPHRILAWPHWDDRGLRTLVAWIEPLVDHPTATLVLHHDPRRDGDLQQALGRLEAAYVERYRADRQLDVLLETRTPDTAALGGSVSGALATGAPRPWLESLGVPLLSGAEALGAHLDALEGLAPERTVIQ